MGVLCLPTSLCFDSPVLQSEAERGIPAEGKPTLVPLHSAFVLVLPPVAVLKHPDKHNLWEEGFI